MATHEHPHTSQGLFISRNIIAAMSSLIPGLGHIYKGQYRMGAGIMVISPFLIWAALILGFATAGIGLLIPLFFLIAISWHAYHIEDIRRHPGGII